MSWPFAVVMIVLIVVAGKVMSSRYRAQHGIVEDKQGNQSFIAKDDLAAQAEIEDLRERIKVLERIATDKHNEAQRLSNEIDRLRDE